MKKTKLKPCPFCGGKDIDPTEERAMRYYHKRWFTVSYVLSCDDCPASVRGIDKKEAEEAWNKRTKRRAS